MINSNFMIIVQFTVREILKSKVLYGVLGIGVLISLFSYLASEFTYGVPHRVAMDVGIGSMSISSLAIALFFGSTLLTKEMENRTIYMTLSRPVSRVEYLLAKISGLLIVLAINILILALFTLGVYFALGGGSAPLLFWTLFYSFLESGLLMVLVVFFSLLTNTTLTVIAGVSVYSVGFILSSTLVTHFAKSTTILSKIISASTFVVPNFDRLNIKEFLLYDQNISTQFLLESTFYATGYMAILLGFILIIFQRKELT